MSDRAWRGLRTEAADWLTARRNEVEYRLGGLTPGGRALRRIEEQMAQLRTEVALLAAAVERIAQRLR